MGEKKTLRHCELTLSQYYGSTGENDVLRGAGVGGMLLFTRAMHHNNNQTTKEIAFTCLPWWGLLAGEQKSLNPNLHNSSSLTPSPHLNPSSVFFLLA